MFYRSMEVAPVRGAASRNLSIDFVVTLVQDEFDVLITSVSDTV